VDHDDDRRLWGDPVTRLLRRGLPDYLPAPGTTGLSKLKLPKVRAAVEAFNAGRADLIFAVVGDSNTIGVGADEDSGGGLNIWNHGPVRKIKTKLQALGLQATDDCLFANANTGDTTDLTTLTHCNPKVTTPTVGSSPWRPSASLYSGNVGGVGFLTADTTSVFAFQCSETQDHCIIELPTNGGNGIIGWSIDGTTWHNIDLGAFPAGITRVDIALGASAAHLFRLRFTTSGNVPGFYSLNFYNSAVRRIRLLLMGYSGGTMANVVSTNFAFQGAHLVNINNTINDRDAGTDATTYTNELTSIIAQAKAQGADVINENPNPSNDNTGGVATANFLSAMQTMVSSLDVPLIDLSSEYPTLTAWENAGFSFNNKHSNDAGYDYRATREVAVYRELLGV